MRICIIDDNVMVRDALMGLLRDSGHEVCAAKDAALGAPLIDRVLPEFVLIDVSLPGTRGDEFACEIRSRHPAMPIVLTSGDAPPPQSIGPRGADVFLAKPFTPAILLEALMRAQMLREKPA